ncbi:uncharacterized protein LOC125728567 [Brienomyrus brachyistius]|uniref:uncharacterized protein LOC125728567 n=1 Tax=Brienomyrus brachyistius TaxID=42636 RepID=UPI0020B34425|nr:uncharacterized protein LOC125728567 [Brienomyrus brachyistius]
MYERERLRRPVKRKSARESTETLTSMLNERGSEAEAGLPPTDEVAYGATPPAAIPEALLNEIAIINNANNENDADYSAQHDSPPAASAETLAQDPCFLPSLETLTSMLNERGSEAEAGLPPTDEVAWSPADSELWEALSDVEFLLDAEEIENEFGLGQFENVQQEGGGAVGDVDPQPDGVLHRRRFNNVQIRRILNIPRPRNEGNFREYYENVIEGFQNIVNEAIPYAVWGAYIQVTLRADFLNDELSQIVRYGVGELTDLQQLLDRLVQSNQEILNDSNLEVIVDVINIPRGGGGNKRKLQTMLASEIISKKARHMFIINNNTNACFAINLAHLLHENLADAEAEKLGLELQEKAGFSPDHTVALNDIINFEKIIDCKAVVYYQQPYSNNLQIYQTPTPTDEFLQPEPLPETNRIQDLQEVEQQLEVQLLKMHEREKELTEQVSNYISGMSTLNENYQDMYWDVLFKAVITAGVVVLLVGVALMGYLRFLREQRKRDLGYVERKVCMTQSRV